MEGERKKHREDRKTSESELRTENDRQRKQLEKIHLDSNRSTCQLQRGRAALRKKKQFGYQDVSEVSGGIKLPNLMYGN